MPTERSFENDYSDDRLDFRNSDQNTTEFMKFQYVLIA